MLLLVFDLLLQYVILLTLTSYFLLCFLLFRRPQNPRPMSILPVFHRPNDLILGRFKGNTILTLLTAFFKLVVCLPIGLLKFIFFRYADFPKRDIN